MPALISKVDKLGYNISTIKATEPASKCLQVKAALCAALYPNAAVKDESAGRAARPAWNDGVADVYIHPSSINHPLEAQQFLRPYLVYLEKARAHSMSSILDGLQPCQTLQMLM
jgi:hypothetical protein